MQIIPSRSQTSPSRRGATMVESTVTLAAFLMLVLGMLDLGVGILHYNTVSTAARMGGRAAIVHGSLAPPELSAWDGQGAKDGVISVIGPLLTATGVRPDEIDVEVIYADGPDAGTTTNDPGDTVTVQVTVPYKPAVGSLLGLSRINLMAKSTMSISH